MNNARVVLITIFIFIALIILVGRLFTIQVSDHERYSKIAKRQQNKSIKIKAERGVIKDRNGELLAFTKNDVSLYVDTRMTNRKEKLKIAKRFSKLFGKSERYYLNKLNSANKNICIEQKAPKEVILQISDFIVNGYFQVEDYSRVYPYGSLASHVLGFTDRNLDGVSGIENQFNEYLTGKDGIKYIENDVQGRLVTFNPDNSIEPESGDNIELTINKNYQLILEEELSKGLKKFKGESGVGIIMDPNTGEILAWSNQPDYDPSNYNLYTADLRRNRAITDTYEPGSTIKPIVMSILLEENLTQEREIINTENGKYKIRGATIKDTHKFETLTSSEIISHSSNIGMAKLSDRIDGDTFYRYLRDYGFGNLTSIDLPGETNGSLKKPKNYSRVSQKFISFGYEISVTPLQLVTSYCALINGGDLLQPFVVKSIKKNNGEIVKSFSRNKIRSVISPKTSKRVIEMMKDAVENGTGVEAKLSQIQVAGKTGTSQRLVNKEYSSSSYNSSFVGFFPADNPKYIALIVVKAPKIGRYGGKVAAPIFHEVASRIVDSDKTLINNPKYNSISRTAEYAYNNNQENKIFITSNLANKEEQKLVDRKVMYNGDSSIMPNLRNYTKRDAIKILNDLGVKYQIVGSGTVVSQSIKSGAKLGSNSICKINCSTKKSNSRLRIN